MRRRNHGTWMDITNDLTDQAVAELEVGQVLMFTFEGSPLHLKIMRKHNGKVWAKENRIYHPDEVITKQLKHPRMEVVRKPESEETEP